MITHTHFTVLFFNCVNCNRRHSCTICAGLNTDVTSSMCIITLRWSVRLLAGLKSPLLDLVQLQNLTYIATQKCILNSSHFNVMKNQAILSSWGRSSTLNLSNLKCENVLSKGAWWRMIFLDFRLYHLKVSQPTHPPTPNIEHFYNSDLITSTYPSPPNPLLT